MVVVDIFQFPVIIIQINKRSVTVSVTFPICNSQELRIGNFLAIRGGRGKDTDGPIGNGNFLLIQNNEKSVTVSVAF